MKKKRVRQKGNPKEIKEPKSPPMVQRQNRKLVWKVSRIDVKSPWGWHKISCPDFLRNIWEKMHNFETMTWDEILGHNHHTIDVKDLTKSAQKWLEELGYDDQEKLVSFRLTGRQRLWAIRSGEEAFLLWWDPNHEICPSHLRHT